VPSTDRLISRPDPAVLGPLVAVGDPALDELAGELLHCPICEPAGHDLIASANHVQDQISVAPGAILVAGLAG